MKVRWFALLALSIFCAFLQTNRAVAQPTLTELDQYREAELSLRYSAWTGISIWRNGAQEELNFFGGNAGEIFAGSPKALDAVETVQTLRITGVSLLVAGLTGLVAGVALAEQGTLSEDTGSGTKLTTSGLALFGSTLAASFAGSLVVGVSYSYVSDAVVYYNRDLYSRLRRPGASGIEQRELRLGWRGEF